MVSIIYHVSADESSNLHHFTETKLNGYAYKLLKALR